MFRPAVEDLPPHYDSGATVCCRAVPHAGRCLLPRTVIEFEPTPSQPHSRSRRRRDDSDGTTACGGAPKAARRSDRVNRSEDQIAETTWRGASARHRGQRGSARSTLGRGVALLVFPGPARLASHDSLASPYGPIESAWARRASRDVRRYPPPPRRLLTSSRRRLAPPYLDSCPLRASLRPRALEAIRLRSPDTTPGRAVTALLMPRLCSRSCRVESSASSLQLWR